MLHCHTASIYMKKTILKRNAQWLQKGKYFKLNKAQAQSKILYLVKSTKLKRALTNCCMFEEFVSIYMSKYFTERVAICSLAPILRDRSLKSPRSCEHRFYKFTKDVLFIENP